MIGEEHAWKKNVNWDVTHQQAVDMVEQGTFVFDPTLSYESTGYRPINEKQGLDFDPAPFKQIGNTRENSKDGRYTTLHVNTRVHREWWENEIKKCNDGVVINNYRLTGDNYFHVNFYTMLKTVKGAKAAAGRKVGHPDFWAAHYEWFHYIELAETFGFDCVGLKARGVGFSEIGACLGVRPYTTVDNFHTMYVASYEPYLTGKGILQKCWTQLQWLNQNTEGGMKHLRQKINQDLHKKASMVDKQDNESGPLSQISGQVIDKADKLRGDRTERIVFEESGSNPVLLTTYAVAQGLVVINGERLGTRIIFGTGGDTGPGLVGLEKMFLNPRGYMILPYRHNHNNSSTYVETGYFIPSWKTVMQAMDHRGVAIEEAAKKYYNKMRNDLRVDAISYLKHCAEYCFTYEEALSRKGQNDFDQVKLADQRIYLEMKPVEELPVRGYLSWIKDDDKKIAGVKFTPHDKGDVWVTEPPVEEDGEAIPNLYVAGIDSIDMGAGDSIVGEDGSKFAMVVKRRTSSRGGDQYVCQYVDRPSDPRRAYEIAMMMCYWYKCEANVEATKIAVIGYFRDKGMITYLMKRPKYALEGQSANQNSSNLIGTQATTKMIEYGLNLVRDFIFDHYRGMMNIDMVIQCQEYDYEFKQRYDIVAAMQMCEIADQDMMGIVPKRPEVQQWNDIGYYIDPETGHRRFGVLPKQQDFYGTLLRE